MKKRGNKLLFGFLIFSLLILLVSIFFKDDPSLNLREDKENAENILTDIREKNTDKENSSTGLSEEKVDKENPSAGLSEDLLNMNPNSIIDHFSVNTQAVSQRKISLESYDLKVETATYWKLPGRLEEISGLGND